MGKCPKSVSWFHCKCCVTLCTSVLYSWYLEAIWHGAIGSISWLINWLLTLVFNPVLFWPVSSRSLISPLDFQALHYQANDSGSGNAWKVNKRTNDSDNLRASKGKGVKHWPERLRNERTFTWLQGFVQPVAGLWSWPQSTSCFHFSILHSSCLLLDWPQFAELWFSVSDLL